MSNTLLNIKIDSNPFLHKNFKPKLQLKPKQQQESALPTPQAPSIFNEDYYLKQENPVYSLLSETHNNQVMQENNFTNKYLKPLNMGITTFGTLGSLWLGFKQYSLMKDQLAMAKEQWNRTKQELDRIQAVRKKLTDSYMNS